MIRRLALVASALSGLPLAAAWIIAQNVLHPKPRVEDHGLDDFGLPAQDVAFASRDGTPLRGWFVPAPGAAAPSPAVVLSHGWARSRAELLPHANFLHRAGFAVLMFDYRHRGESGGGAVTLGLREGGDLLGALDTLAARPEVDAGRIGVFGMSMGGVIAILVAAEDERVRALAVECPYSGAEAIMGRALRHYYRLPSFPLAPLTRWVLERRLGEPLDVPDARERVPRISPRPLFVIAAERDAVIGHDETERVFAAAREPKQFWLVAAADHARCWQAAREEYERRVATFFQEALSTAAAPSLSEAAAEQPS